MSDFYYESIGITIDNLKGYPFCDGTTTTGIPFAIYPLFIEEGYLFVVNSSSLFIFGKDSLKNKYDVDKHYIVLLDEDGEIFIDESSNFTNDDGESYVDLKEYPDITKTLDDGTTVKVTKNYIELGEDKAWGHSGTTS